MHATARFHKKLLPNTMIQQECGYWFLDELHEGGFIVWSNVMATYITKL